MSLHGLRALEPPLRAGTGRSRAARTPRDVGRAQAAMGLSPVALVVRARGHRRESQARAAGLSRGGSPRAPAPAQAGESNAGTGLGPDAAERALVHGLHR